MTAKYFANNSGLRANKDSRELVRRPGLQGAAGREKHGEISTCGSINPGIWFLNKARQNADYFSSFLVRLFDSTICLQSLLVGSNMGTPWQLDGSVMRSRISFVTSLTQNQNKPKKRHDEILRHKFAQHWEGLPDSRR